MAKRKHRESSGQSPDMPQKQLKATSANTKHSRYESNYVEGSTNSPSNSIGASQRLQHPRRAPKIIKTLNYSVSSQPTSSSVTSLRGVPGKAYNGHPSTLPPLPSIKDASLESTIFTHHASLEGHASTKLAISYDRLEFLGDAYIEVIASRLLFPRFPMLSAGRLSQQREMLVRNETLADYALAYRFDERAKLPSSMKRGGTDGTKIWTKTMGDVFEAYTAAIIVSDPEHGFDIAESWLTALWMHKLATQSDTNTQIVDLNAKTQLATKVMGKGIKLKYLDEKPPDQLRTEGKLIFYIGAFLTGWGWENVKLGSGKGLSKQEAGANAAADALTNALTAQVASVKREFDANSWLEKNIEPTADGEETKGEKQSGGS